MRPGARRPLLAGGALLLALALAGCSDSDSGSGSGSGGESGPELTVGGAYMPQPLAADMAAGFLTVTNKGGTDDALTAVSSELAEKVTLHETVDRSMREVREFPVPAGGRLRLASGGSHLMFEGIRRKPEQGEKVPVKLTFEKSGTLTVRLPVKSATYQPRER
ncbi:hypothetical protein SLNWT_3746 [Streptomyces albus]|uniref:Copper chaperone PCu(A)C n=1 Tax=Streptomyces albus (strain ATCC 21838 / DSM 41398 / FERM P-419 / JCM 4703 / NBRC 107858) TaxID=1081613 RepID=A0A0B5F1A7_STRA4|nr:hypothetical protein SLNWT_3746 [Streptomyces albus]AOU78427.1 hypothetical protein SLNHY_3736 [Streptomyces albus]AYN34174.1 hypothetical protein DUI70_3674 [Streptomyces albus]